MATSNHNVSKSDWQVRNLPAAGHVDPRPTYHIAIGVPSRHRYLNNRKALLCNRLARTVGIAGAKYFALQSGECNLLQCGDLQRKVISLLLATGCDESRRKYENEKSKMRHFCETVV